MGQLYKGSCLIMDSGGGGLPDQTGMAGKYLTTDGSSASWGDIQAGAVSSLIVYVTLGEAVTAGDGKGACYIGLDGKAYLSTVSGYNYCDGIVIDSGTAGDSVRMIIGGFVPCTGLNNNNGIVSLAYTSGTTNTGYGDYMAFSGSSTNNYGGIIYATIDNVIYNGLCIIRGAFTDYNNNYLPLYGKSGTTFSSGNKGGVSFSGTFHYATGIPGQYGDNLEYTISGCKLGHKVPGGFIFNPEPREILALSIPYDGTGKKSRVAQANFTCEHIVTAMTGAGSSTSHLSVSVRESIDNTNWTTIFQNAHGANASDGADNSVTGKFLAKKGFYYQLNYYAASSNTTFNAGVQ